MLLTGCVDESYDLSDIDTTMKFEVDNLTLPLNLAPVEFASVVDLSNEECIDTINGEYVLVQEGTFDSDEIKIGDFTAEADYDFDETLGNITIGPGIAIPGYSAPLGVQDYHFLYTSYVVDKSITAVYSGTVDPNEELVISFKIHARSDNQGIKCKFKNLVFALPEGYYGVAESNGKTYKVKPEIPESNIVSVGEVQTDNNGDYTFSFHVDNFQFENNPIAPYNEDYNKFSLNSLFALKSGDIEFLDTHHGAVELSTSFHVSDFKVKYISGYVNYVVENLNPKESLSLDNLPELLKDKQTMIKLNNPQLYVKVKNPLAGNDVTASLGLTITPIRGGIDDSEAAATLNSLTIAAKAEQSFCLSPKNPTTETPKQDFIAGFSDAEWNQIDKLGDILWSENNGLPDELKVNFIDPKMDTPVNNIDLTKESYGKVHGDYKFFAPLALGKGSQIYYSSEATEWGLSSEDDQLNIKKLAIEADVVSELPVAVTLTAKPLDDQGNPINVHVDPVDIPAFGKKPIIISMEGDIVNLDGMEYTIIVKAGEHTQALKPTQHLTLNNLKVRVSGSYVVEDEDK